MNYIECYYTNKIDKILGILLLCGVKNENIKGTLVRGIPYIRIS